jgi:hypothetical protein
MKRSAVSLCFGSAFVTAFVLASVTGGRAQDNESDSRVLEGLRIARENNLLRTDAKIRNLGLVGLGSYIVNAAGGCADCHSCPTYAPGHNPYMGGDGRLNAANYLAGGVPFPIPPEPNLQSANITPDPVSGLPEDRTFEQFKQLIRTGHEESGEILQVMPWPFYRHMTDHDLRAVYEFLSALPHRTPGICVAPGQ